jgi:hypothetical protein
MPQPTKTTWWGQMTLTRRRMIFFYDIGWLVVLLAIAIVMLRANNCAPPKPPNGTYEFAIAPCCRLWVKYKLFFNSLWMGALGGITISLKGIYDHGASSDPWKNDYNLWHVGRPISGAIAGFIAALLLFLVLPIDKVSNVILYGIAFIFGTQDRAFFDFLSQFAARFLPKPEDKPPVGARINAVYPSHGKPGTILTIQGQGLKPDWTVKLGAHPIAEQSVTPDGNTAVGKVPAIAAIAPGTTQVLDLVIVDKGGSGPTLSGKFTYEQP